MFYGRVPFNYAWSQVVTYHMPCLFGSDEKCQVVAAHVALLMQAAQRFAQALPLVVAGDFNFKPGEASTAYSPVRPATIKSGETSTA
jgi:hypothetical protein